MKRRQFLLIIAGIVVVLAGAAAELVLASKDTRLSTRETSNMAPKATKTENTEVDGHYLLNGTVTWARAVEKYAAGNYAQPFNQLDTFHRDQYDAWSTDFECP